MHTIIACGKCGNPILAIQQGKRHRVECHVCRLSSKLMKDADAAIDDFAERFGIEKMKGCLDEHIQTAAEFCKRHNIREDHRPIITQVADDILVEGQAKFRGAENFKMAGLLAIVQQLEACNFEDASGHALETNSAFIALKEMAAEEVMAAEEGCKEEPCMCEGLSEIYPNPQFAEGMCFRLADLLEQALKKVGNGHGR